MALALRSIMHDLEDAVAGGDAGRRVRMLRSMTGLFAGQAPLLDEAQVDAFDMVILRLSRGIEADARSELSERLAGIANAPRDVVRNLAYDRVAAVAAPVLQRSGRLAETDLVAIAGTRGPDHLQAMALRSMLGPGVTDIMVSRGDAAVIRAVARNAGAAFSGDGYATLVARAESDRQLHDSLQARADVPPPLRPRLIGITHERLRASLDAGSVAAAEAGTSTTRDSGLLQVEIFVGAQARKGGLEETVLIGWIDSGRETAALVGLARVAGVPSGMAVKAYHAESYEPLLFLVRSVRFGLRLLTLFMAAKAGRPLDADTLTGVREAFQALSVATAQKVVTFTAAKEREAAR